MNYTQAELEQYLSRDFAGFEWIGEYRTIYRVISFVPVLDNSYTWRWSVQIDRSPRYMQEYRITESPATIVTSMSEGTLLFRLAQVMLEMLVERGLE